jgi:hypothetical protein
MFGPAGFFRLQFRFIGHLASQHSILLQLHKS